MLTLITYPETFGSPAASPFCVKAMYLLNAAGVAWQREDTNDPRKMPRAKLPVLRTPDGLVHDSDNIRAWLEQHGHEFDQGLSDLDRATSRAFIRMAEEHMYFHIVLDRWGRDDVWPAIRDQYFHEIPPVLRGFITRGLRKTLIKGMDAQGLGRMPEAERMERLEKDLSAISARLWDGPFLFGDTATAADASVAPILDNMRKTPVETPLSKRIGDDQQLCDYMDRVHATMMPA